MITTFQVSCTVVCTVESRQGTCTLTIKTIVILKRKKRLYAYAQLYRVE